MVEKYYSTEKALIYSSEIFGQFMLQHFKLCWVILHQDQSSLQFLFNCNILPLRVDLGVMLKKETLHTS